MEININELNLVIEKLKGDKNVKNFLYILENIKEDSINNKRDTVNIIDRNHYLATALWQDEDIITCLSDNYPEIKICDENILEIAIKVESSDIESGMIATGWDYMDNIISELERKGELIKNE